MDHRRRILAVVILTVMIALSVGFVTEYVRQSMTFYWAIEEGDVFIFDVTVTGNTTTGTTTLPSQLISMNNTRITVVIISLPNVTITFYARNFIEDIVMQLKTRSTFVNGTDIPSEYYFEFNTHVSRSMLPVGGWSHLDLFFPNEIDRPIMEHESYLSARLRNSFYFGYSSNETNEASEWHGIIDLTTGVPQIVSFWLYQTNQPWTIWYNVTMSRVT
ncbi:MAG: hypothetical protein ACW97G_08740 [Candidatus Thorarchaeota archaeon]|jgi:hypothetical protein